MAANKTNLEALLVANFTCKICSQILYDPVQCENNGRYFCQGSHLCTLKIEMDKMKTRFERVTRILEQISGNQATLQAKLEACEEFVEVSEESEEESMPDLSSTMVPQKSTSPPTMKGQIFMSEKRAGCAAVIMGDTIVVMGGGRRNRKNCMTAQLRSVVPCASRMLL